MVFFGTNLILSWGGEDTETKRCKGSDSGDLEAGDINLDGDPDDKFSCCGEWLQNVSPYEWKCSAPPHRARIHVPGEGWLYLEKFSGSSLNKGKVAYTTLGEGLDGIKSAAHRGGTLFAAGDLVRFRMGEETITSRIEGFHFEFDNQAKVVRRAALFGDWRINGRGGVELSKLTLVKPAADLDTLADLLIARLKRMRPKELARREAILSYADFRDLKSTPREELVKIEQRLQSSLEKQIGKLEIDDGGKRFLLRKIKEKMGIAEKNWNLASR